jgi:phosphopantothenoylcysteine decarboxylase / phosphopantothenate---cysteine ligase
MNPLDILITAGPTREAIDPVRFITNHSTGTMGYAIACKAKARGYRVTLISGPVCIKPPLGVRTIQVETARQMFAQVKRHIKSKDCLVMAAAVSDFRPEAYSNTKVKKNKAIKPIYLTRNPDILSWANTHKKGSVIVGFCMETEGLLSRARKKLHAKNADIIIANKISKAKTPFGKVTTDIIVVDKENALNIKNASKEKIAGIILDKIKKLWYKKHSVYNA